MKIPKFINKTELSRRAGIGNTTLAIHATKGTTPSKVIRDKVQAEMVKMAKELLSDNMGVVEVTNVTRERIPCESVYADLIINGKAVQVIIEMPTLYDLAEGKDLYFQQEGMVGVEKTVVDLLMG